VILRLEAAGPGRTRADAHGLTVDDIEACTERSRREPVATGETVRKRTVEALIERIAQESQIAHLAGAGHTNAEVGAQMCVSLGTVEWHVRKIFTKLGISSRREVRWVLRNAGPIVG
jgi:DNA-binding NarL/FixJ family response regulator